MKIKLLLVIVLFAGIIALVAVINGSSDSEVDETVTISEKYTIKEAYKYPALPGKPGWEQLGSTQDKKKACEVPKDILSKMTTEALVETIVTYPYFTDVNAFETLDQGVEALRLEFGGVDELLTRADAYECIIAFINSVDPEYLNIKSEEEFDSFMTNFNEKNTTGFDILHLINAKTLLNIISNIKETL